MLLSAKEGTTLRRMGQKSRKFPRFAFGQAATLQASGGKLTANVTILEISARGCEVEHTAGLNIGKKCELYFDWQRTYIGLEAQAVWNKQAQGRSGLLFRNVDHETQRRLNTLCSALSKQKASKGRDEAEASAPAAPAEKPSEEHPAFPVAAAPSPPRPRISERSRRGLPRYASNLPGRLLNLASGDSIDVVVVEISISGGRLQGAALPETGQLCELHTETSSGGKLIVQGEVVWKAERDVGLKFLSPDEETVKELREICRGLRLLPPPPSL